jgi:hypothetical protein
MFFPQEIQSKILLYLSFVPFDKDELIKRVKRVIKSSTLNLDKSNIRTTRLIDIYLKRKTIIYESYHYLFWMTGNSNIISENRTLIEPLFTDTIYYDIEYIKYQLKYYKDIDKKYIYYKYVNEGGNISNITNTELIRLHKYCIYKLY